MRPTGETAARLEHRELGGVRDLITKDLSHGEDFKYYPKMKRLCRRSVLNGRAMPSVLRLFVARTMHIEDQIQG